MAHLRIRGKYVKNIHTFTGIFNLAY